MKSYLGVSLRSVQRQKLTALLSVAGIALAVAPELIVVGPMKNNPASLSTGGGILLAAHSSVRHASSTGRPAEPDSESRRRRGDAAVRGCCAAWAGDGCARGQDRCRHGRQDSIDAGSECEHCGGGKNAPGVKHVGPLGCSCGSSRLRSPASAARAGPAPNLRGLLGRV